MQRIVCAHSHLRDPDTDYGSSCFRFCCIRYEPTTSSDAPDSARSTRPNSSNIRSRLPTVTGPGDSDSASEDEGEIFMRGGSSADSEVEEDIKKREEELQAELNIATLRCNELQRTLQATKSFMATPGQPLGGGAPMPRPGVPAESRLAKARPQPLTIQSNDDEYSTDEDFYEESADFEVAGWHFTHPPPPPSPQVLG